MPQYHLFKKLLLFAFSLVPVITGASGAGEPENRESSVANWPHWRGIGWDSKSKETDWSPKNLRDENVVWKINVGKGYSSMAIVDGRVYTAGNRQKRETVSCIDSRTGRIVWENRLEQRIASYIPSQSTPTLERDRLYLLTSAGAVFCLNRKNGRTIWSFDLLAELDARLPRWSFSSSVKIYNDLAVVNIGTGGAAFNKNTGKLVWAHPEGEAGYTTPVIFTHEGRDLLAVSTNDQILVVDPDDGVIVCTYPWAGSLQDYPADPLIIQRDGKTEILISHAYQQGAALLEFNGEDLNPVWEDREIVSNINSLASFGKYIWATSNPAYSSRDTGSEFFCMDITDGSKAWTQQQRMGSLISVGEYIIRLDQMGTVSIGKRSLTGFKESASLKVLNPTSIVPPAFSNGKLFCRNDAGDLVCIDLSN